WTAGVQPHKLVRDLPFETDKYDKVLVNDFYQTKTHENIYVIGDNASSEYSPSAQLAGQQGEQLAIILSDIIRNIEPRKPKEIELRGSLCSLGDSVSVANIFSQSLNDLLPRLTKSYVLWLQKRH